MHDRGRLDGLNESYFNEITLAEMAMAFKYLPRRYGAGGTEKVSIASFSLIRPALLKSWSSI